MSAPADTVIIHGHSWNWADISDVVAECRRVPWTRQRWRAQPALAHRQGGVTSLYVGQQYDPAKIDLVPNGWSHDHCEVCWWELFESDDEAHFIGYTDGQGWLCTECYERFINSDTPV